MSYQMQGPGGVDMEQCSVYVSGLPPNATWDQLGKRCATGPVRGGGGPGCFCVAGGG